MMDVRETFDKMVGRKKRIEVKQFVMGFLLVSATLFSVLLDYVSVSFNPEIFQNPGYWLRLLTTNSAVVIIMMSFRGYMKERELATNPDIIAAQKNIDMAHVELNRRNLRTVFEDHVNAINAERKLKAYRDRLLLKLSRCRREKRRKRLEARLAAAERDVEFMRVRYHKVRISTIFCRTKLREDEDEDLEFGERREVGRMLLNKVISVIGFGVLGASFLFETNGFFLATLITTVIKLFQTSYAVYVGASEGATFARGTMLTKMQLRLDFVQKFIEQQNRGKDTAA